MLATVVSNCCSEERCLTRLYCSLIAEIQRMELGYIQRRSRPTFVMLAIGNTSAEQSRSMRLDSNPAWRFCRASRPRCAEHRISFCEGQNLVSAHLRCVRLSVWLYIRLCYSELVRKRRETPNDAHLSTLSPAIHSASSGTHQPSPSKTSRAQ